MKDFASPNSSLQPQGSNNARFSPRSRHTSPQGGTAAYSLTLQSPVTESQSKHHKDKSGRSLLSRLLSLNANTLARNNSGESEVKDGEILKSPPPVSERSSLTTASRVENGKSDQVSKSKDTVVDGGISLLSPASMGGFGDSRTSAFQPNLLRTNRDVKTIDYKASNYTNSSRGSEQGDSRNR